MICAELEQMEGQLDEIITALEDSAPSDERKRALEAEYHRLSRLINEHQSGGHAGGPCYQE